MRRTPIATLSLLTAVAAASALTATPAAAKGLVGMSVCGAHGCVDRTALVGHGRDAEALLETGDRVADPGRAAFVRLKMHMGDGGQSFGHTTLIYLPRQGLVRTPDGSWWQPMPSAATAFKRAARHVAAFPAADLKRFDPPPLPEARVVETVTPAHSAAAKGRAGDGGGGDGLPLGLVGGAAAAALLAAGGALLLARRGRPATG